MTTRDSGTIFPELPAIRTLLSLDVPQSAQCSRQAGLRYVFARREQLVRCMRRRNNQVLFLGSDNCAFAYGDI